MRVHLVFAPSLVQSGSEALGENIWPPMGVMYLAAYLRSKLPKITIKITDGCRIGFQKTIHEIENFQPDIIGISFYTTQAQGAAKLSQEARKRLPNSLVIIGGPHATALPLETLKESQANFCVVGEGENTFYQIVRGVSQGLNKDYFRTLTGVWSLEKYGKHEKVYRNAPANFINPLDLIPFPARDLCNMHDYRGWFISQQNPQTTMLFTRGCPFRCTFCANCVWQSSTPFLRVRSPKNIVDEMEFLEKEFGIKEVYDQADEFNHSIDHALEVCREIKRRKLGMTWQVSLRAHPFSSELAKEMSEAGCWCVSMGIESGNPEALKGIRKHITLEDVERTCSMLRYYGIKVRAHFMLYNVWEDNGKLQFEDSKMSLSTINYANNLFKRNLINYITCSIATPFPGSELYNIAVRHNLINDKCVNNWDMWLQKKTFIIELPGIREIDRIKVKAMGEIVRAMCMIKNRDYKLKDFPYIIKRVGATLQTVFQQ
jgi:radical SAM superfamily enzyme YgiQ (UPF0313 family)